MGSENSIAPCSYSQPNRNHKEIVKKYKVVVATMLEVENKRIAGEIWVCL